MADMPLTEVEALFYHEGVPGHHMQRAIQTELKDVPAFRKFGGVTASNRYRAEVSLFEKE